MTFVVKTRGAGAWLMAEYACPAHGIFEQLVQRDADGNAPDSVRCGDCSKVASWTISVDQHCTRTVAYSDVEVSNVASGAAVRRAGKLEAYRKALGKETKPPQPTDSVSAAIHLEQYTAMQREDGQPTFQAPREAMRSRGSAEWSRQLREKVRASEHKMRHQVLVDLQDEP